MHISTEWLGEFVELPSLQEICERLLSAGVEVEEISDPASCVQGVVVAEITGIEPHPDADKLSVCQVFDGVQIHQVVCGAANVAVGLRVAYAKSGAVLPGGVTIGRKPVRGVPSAGMLCARSELGLVLGASDKSAGIWELPAQVTLGASVFAECPVSPTLVLGLTPNRPDLLSHVGVARELGAATGKRLRPGKWRLTEKGPDVGTLARVVVEDTVGCKRYAARVVRGVKVGPSPRWLRERLERVGQRSINNVVDATNYVLFEMGQPLHAFDLSRLGVEAGCPTVHVRRAQAGEKLRTLDGVDRVLGTEDLVVADPDRVLALAGVMGGADSQVTESTTTVLLESAYFEPTRVRQASKRHGLRTESAQRFERGADIGIVMKALDRCAQLLAEVADGDVAKGVVEMSPKADTTREITLRLKSVPRILGIELGAEALVQLLDPLDIKCVARNELSLRFSTPSFRPDLTREADLIEEVARRHGYDRIPDRLPNTGGPYVAEPLDREVKEHVRASLLAQGVSEAVTYGFGSPSDYGTQDVVRLLNPLGEELSVMRTSLIPGLLRVLNHNMRHGQEHVRVFEMGTCFQARTPGLDEDIRDKDLPTQTAHVSWLYAGGRALGRWHAHNTPVDFSDLKASLEHVLASLHILQRVRFEPASEAPRFNPMCCVKVWVGDVCCGVAGQLDPSYAAQWDVQEPVFVAELSLDVLCSTEPLVVRHVSLPKFPKMRRDVAVLAPVAMHAETVLRYICDHAGGALGPSVVEEVRVFDVYKGPHIPQDKVSLAFAIEYRSPARTLTDAEVASAFEQLLAGLKADLHLDVRGS